MKIWKIGILVEDLKSAEDFYVNVMEMKVISRGARFVFLDAGEVRLELIHKDAWKDDPRLGKVGVHHLSFQVEDIQKEAKRLKEKGATFIKDPFYRMEGLQLAFIDGLNNVNLQLFDDKR